MQKNIRKFISLEERKKEARKRKKKRKKRKGRSLFGDPPRATPRPVVYRLE